MLTATVLLLITTTVIAQDESVTLLAPTRNQALPSDAFTVKWSYDFDYTGLFTLLLSPHTNDYWSEYVVSTTVFAEDSSTTLPTSVLPSVSPHDTSLLDVLLYTTDGMNTIGPSVFSVSLVGTPATVTATVTATSVVTSEAQESDAKDGGGLSIGAKAGIGVGAGVGALLIAAGLFLLLWWRRRNKKPKVIREISAAGPASALFLGAEGREKGGPDIVPGAVPLPSEEGGTSVRRFELGG